MYTQHTRRGHVVNGQSTYIYFNRQASELYHLTTSHASTTQDLFQRRKRFCPSFISEDKFLATKWFLRIEETFFSSTFILFVSDKYTLSLTRSLGQKYLSPFSDCFTKIQRVSGAWIKRKCGSTRLACEHQQGRISTTHSIY